MAPSGGNFVALCIAHKHTYAVIDTGAHHVYYILRWCLATSAAAGASCNQVAESGRTSYQHSVIVEDDP